IAVGMATKIPPHNLNEVVSALVALIENSDISLNDLMNKIPGPDFPTGGMMLGIDGIKSAYESGRGKIKIRGRAHVETKKSGKESIIISEIPFQVNKSNLIEKIADLVRDKRVEGISDLRDESDKDGMRIVVEIKRGSVPEVILNQLYKFTQLQDTFGIILLAITNGIPKVMAIKEILNELNVTVIGGMPSKIEECLIPLQNKKEENELIVAAIPFLRDSDLRSIDEEVVYENRIEAIRKGIEATFTKAAKTSKDLYPELPVLAMGHLYAAGIESSDSERDIQIGNQAAFQASQFGTEFSYVALGHIHKPQRVNAKIPTFYSGSPLPLSFSERKDEKRLLLIDTEKGFEPESIAIPSFRKLIRISGSIAEIQQKLFSLESQGSLTNLIEVELKEENYDANLIAQLDDLVTNFEKANFEIVKHRATFKNQLRESGKLFESHQHLEDLKPQEVFQKLLAQHSYAEEVKEKVNIAFQELLEEVNHN
ncbi:exonuclease SbcCD subunit D C-terminal domain-containing protein, partial [Mesonia mobilis]|uniref:exonuclease SbcCD subunit D C-terminal domain-containing protein n=1 Tax=Mesonia mobilis TaxID=369791 RepID=UPI0026F23844